MKILKKMMLSMLLGSCTYSMAMSMEKSSGKDIDRKQALLTKYGFRLKLFNTAVDSGIVDMVRKMLDNVPAEQKSAFVTYIDSNNYTALHSAAFYGYVEIVQLLIQALPKEQKYNFVMLQNNEGCTALHMVALNSGNLEIARMLLDAVPEDQRSSFVMTKEKQGFTAAQLAKAQKFVLLATMLEKYDTH